MITATELHTQKLQQLRWLHIRLTVPSHRRRRVEVFNTVADGRNGRPEQSTATMLLQLLVYSSLFRNALVMFLFKIELRT